MQQGRVFMKMHNWVLLRVGVIALLGYTLSACTIVTDPTASSSDFTSSTSGKSSSGKATNQEEKASLFAAANFDRLKEDMAKGRGEHLSSFALLLGIPKE